MKGINFSGDRTIRFLDVADPKPGPTDAVLEIKGSGMCGSDLKFYRETKAAGRPQLGFRLSDNPVIAGHEPCGVVMEVGSQVDPRFAKPGDRVMVHHYMGCGICPHCRTGWTQLCKEQDIVVYGVTAHGGHAPYMLVPAITLVPLPESLSFEAGAAISCGTGTAYNALRRMNVSGRDAVAVFGQGPVGLAGTQLGTAMGARVIAVDINADRLARATEFGAIATINPTETDPIAAILDLTGGKGVDCALEAAGSEQSRLACAMTTKTWGTMCVVGEGGNLVLDVSVAILRRQLTILGSWTFSSLIQAECTKFIVDHKIPVDKVFTHRWHFDQAVEAYQLFDKQTAGKGVFLN
jgi:threonine dehydrogenase-like Zn-dependent dehydrogenase